ncbi:hypothetical protein MCEWOLH11_00879 [Candidatus Methylopumilus universalis]|uniref:hypothetical protein n=1 Tax=Candidatus Methylopumilus universalis TaxID=2588536 RepID=UPI003BEF4602
MEANLRKLLNLSPYLFNGTVLSFSFTLLFSLYSWLPLLDAKWSIIDDHEIVSAIGPRDRLPISEIPYTLNKTEVGADSNFLRFRPSYYSIRYFEAAIWGKEPSLWYATRIIIFSIFALALTAISLRTGGVLLTLGFLVFELSRPYWSDMIARLGPSETYAVLGVSLTMIGFLFADKKGWSTLPCFLLTAGIIVAAGSKENFVILAILPLWLIFSPIPGLSLKLKSILSISLVYSLWISAVIINRLSYIGHDVYAQSTSLGSRLTSLYSFVLSPEILVLFAIYLPLYFFILHTKKYNTQEKSWLISVNKYVLSISALLTLIFSQHFFYGGHWLHNVHTRYAFPGMFAVHAAFFLLFIVVAKIAGARRQKLAGHIWVIYLVGALSFLTLSIGKITSNRASSIARVSESNSFTERLNEAFNFLRAHPNAILIINSHSIWDYEPIFSIQRFLQASGLTNPITLNINGYLPSTFSADSQKLELLLSTQLNNLQNQGGEGFEPLHKLDSISNCFSLGMSGPPLVECESGNIIYRP